MRLLKTILVTWLVLQTRFVHNFDRVCYLLGNIDYTLIEPSSIKWELCSHLIFAFARLSNTSMTMDNTLTQYINSIKRFNQTQVKYLISLGVSQVDFTEDNHQMTKFLDSLMSLLNKYNLDGVDIDWEFPYNQKYNFSKFLKMIRARFEAETKARSDHKRYLLSAALTPVIAIVELSYHIPSISRNVDFINLMTYDFHTPNTIPYTNYNSPLYANDYDLLYFKYFNVQFSANYMHKLGLRKEQIMVGVPFYGYLYYLANEQFHGVYALSNGTQVSVNYCDICNDFLISPFTTRVFDRSSKVPYAYNGNRWITYDDTESIAIKAQWIADNNFGGSMTFALNFDDFRGHCSSTVYSLQQTIYDILK